MHDVPQEFLGPEENVQGTETFEAWQTDNAAPRSTVWKVMTSPTINLDDMAYAIQLALTPVFLLTGIAGMLNVITGRLARIIDRGRHVAESSRITAADIAGPLSDELSGLERRRHLASAAITACTFSALLVCTVVAALFLEVLLKLNFKVLLGVLFTGATFALVVGLGYFLREVHLATKTVRIAFAPPR